MRTFAFTIFVSASIGLILLGASCAPKTDWESRTLFFFDTVCDITLSCSEERARAAEKHIVEIFGEVEALFAPGSGETASPLVLRLFSKARGVHDISGGAFDITVAPLMEAWGMYSGQRPRVPSEEEILSALALVGQEKIVLRPDGLRLSGGMRLDWGGIAKGFGVDLAAEAVMNKGVENGFINAGGDLYCWGSNPEGRPWKIGIKHPRRQGFLAVLSIANLGAATSGDYQRYHEVDGIRYHHLLDPKTGFPARGKQSVTVIGPETAICDALSTALFVSEHAEDILKSFPEYGAVMVFDSGRITLAGKKFNVSFLQ